MLSFVYLRFVFFFIIFFFNDPATTEIYTLSLHDALPISRRCEARQGGRVAGGLGHEPVRQASLRAVLQDLRSEEHTSELQSRRDLVCRLLLEKKKKTITITP